MILLTDTCTSMMSRYHETETRFISDEDSIQSIFPYPSPNIIQNKHMKSVTLTSVIGKDVKLFYCHWCIILLMTLYSTTVLLIVIDCHLVQGTVIKSEEEGGVL